MSADILYIKNTPSSQTLTKAAGDVVADKSQYAELVKVPDWRLILSDAAVSPFQWKGKQWKTAEHAIQAASDPELFNTYTLNSGSVIARGSPENIATGKAPPSDDVLAEIWKAKFTQDQKSRSTLALTGQAQLWAMRGKKFRWTALETIREAQRNATVEPEMADAPATAKKTKAAPKTKKAQAVEAVKEDAQVNVFAENTVATAPVKEAPPPDMEAAEETESSLKFCPVCDNYLYMEVDPESQALTRMCRKCGHKENDTKGGLVMEMMIQQQSSEGYKILLNEFTRKDPRLPHIRKNITCPNVTCDSNKGGKDPDVIYIKYDLVNLMYLYICDICGEKWHSRDRT
jgi:DNA-directed RNA polymerase subunit M/transcription elongation factor TFIIS